MGRTKRLTLVITPDIEPVIDKAKRMFYDRKQSDIIRMLIAAGLKEAATWAKSTS